MAGPNSTKKAPTTSSGIAMADDIENRSARVPAKRLLLQSAKLKFSKTKRSGSRSLAKQKRIGITLSEACREFLEETRQRHRPKTYSQYKTALDYFRQSCREKPLSVVERADIMTFMGFLSDRGLARRTIWTKVQVVVSMLKANGVTKLIRKRDWPRYTETEPEGLHQRGDRNVSCPMQRLSQSVLRESNLPMLEGIFVAAAYQERDLIAISLEEFTEVEPVSLCFVISHEAGCCG
jgi:hypothetical protein